MRMRFGGFDWSNFRKSLLATYFRDSEVVSFWDLNKPISEFARNALIKNLGESLKHTTEKIRETPDHESPPTNKMKLGRGEETSVDEQLNVYNVTLTKPTKQI